MSRTSVYLACNRKLKMSQSNNVPVNRGLKNDGFEMDMMDSTTDMTGTNGEKVDSSVEAIVTKSSKTNKIDGIQSPLGKGNIATRSIVWARSWIYDSVVSNETILIRLFLIGLFIAYFVYFGFAVAYGWKTCPSYCDGIRFLFILTSLSLAGLIYFQLIKRFFGKTLYRNVIRPLENYVDVLWKHKWLQWLLYFLLISALVIFLVIDSKSNRQRLISAGGIVVLTLLGFIFSKYPSEIRWRHVFWGLGLQFVLALLILRWEVGREVFQCLGDKVQLFLNFTDYGASFVFGYLTTGVLTGWSNVTVNNVTYDSIPLPNQAQLFAFKVLPVMFYFSFFISILYFYGVMQWLVQKLGWLLQVTVGTTACESINAAACIFVGQTEAPLVIKPYLPKMTKSEIHAVMTGGFANIAGSTLAAYISFGINASHLLSASIMSAPAALAYAKLLLPEVEISQTQAKNIKMEKGEERNALEAAANGAAIAIGLVASIAANLISFIAFIYFLDGVLSWMGSLVGFPELTFEWILAQVFTPLAFVMGVSWDECEKVGKLIGIKTIINEFVAYSELATMVKNGELSTRAETIATYALCGFSNLSSLGIQLGCLGAMAPERKPDISQVALRALVAGSAACFMTACVADITVLYIFEKPRNYKLASWKPKRRKMKAAGRAINE